MEDTKRTNVAFHIPLQMFLDILFHPLDRASYWIVACLPSFGENSSFCLWLNHLGIMSSPYHYLFLFSQYRAAFTLRIWTVWDLRIRLAIFGDYPHLYYSGWLWSSDKGLVVLSLVTGSTPHIYQSSVVYKVLWSRSQSFLKQWTQGTLKQASWCSAVSNFLPPPCRDFRVSPCISASGKSVFPRFFPVSSSLNGDFGYISYACVVSAVTGIL